MPVKLLFRRKHPTAHPLRCSPASAWVGLAVAAVAALVASPALASGAC